MIKFAISLLATLFCFSLIALGQRIASDHVENLSDSIFNAAIEKGHLVGASVAIYNGRIYTRHAGFQPARNSIALQARCRRYVPH